MIFQIFIFYLKSSFFLYFLLIWKKAVEKWNIGLKTAFYFKNVLHQLRWIGTTVWIEKAVLGAHTLKLQILLYFTITLCNEIWPLPSALKSTWPPSRQPSDFKQPDFFLPIARLWQTVIIHTVIVFSARKCSPAQVKHHESGARPQEGASIYYWWRKIGF